MELSASPYSNPKEVNMQPQVYKKVAVIIGKSLPQPKNSTDERITVLVAEEKSFPIPDGVTVSDRYYRHDTVIDGSLRAEEFLKIMDEGVTLFVYPDLGSTRTFIRITNGYYYIYKKDSMLDTGVYAVILIEDFLSEYRHEQSDFFARRITNILERSVKPVIRVEITIHTAKIMMGWNGELEGK